MLKSNDSEYPSEDFIGIAVLNSSDIRIGKNPY